MNPKLQSLKDNKEEIDKCRGNLLYFYNTYVLKEGEKPLTQDQYDEMIKQEVIKKRFSFYPVLPEDAFKK